MTTPPLTRIDSLKRQLAQLDCARPAAGSKVPLAVLRKRGADVPLDFTLDDSLAMSPAARLSSASQVVASARVSKSGSASPQRRDLKVTSAPGAVGGPALRLEIAETVG